MKRQNTTPGGGEIEARDRYAIQPGAMAAEIDGEIVALDPASGICFGLNGTGSRVWQLLASPNSLQGICETLLSEYEIDPATCEREVKDLLFSLRSEGLILAAHPGGSTET